ncbi:MAG: rhomboid family intramembrane serine protease [Wenzhouxiangellaceae bacterium]|nr:rhomboid family intramembrane serine protease [Wenzhouxiangellaceae bacterium]
MIAGGRRSHRRATARFPWAVLLLGGLALAVQTPQAIFTGAAGESWLAFWGFRPAQVAAILDRPISEWADPALGGLFGALLAHTGWLHLLGNVAYLWVFGIPVERSIGSLRLLLLFGLLGALSNAVVALQLPEFDRLVLGASGGVSAVVGIYFGLFPTRRIGLWLPLGLFLQFARIPALIVIGSWFTLQLLYSVFGPVSGAVAWWTHVAGFVLGLAAALVLRALPGRVVLDLPED